MDKSVDSTLLVDYIYSYLATDMRPTENQGHILFIEDSPTVGVAIGNMLNRHGYEHTQAISALEAISLIEDNSVDGTPIYDLMITDINLEGTMSGCDLVRQLRFGLNITRQQLPIIACSSNIGDHKLAITKLFAAQADDFLEKPILEPILITRIQQLLRKN